MGVRMTNEKGLERVECNGKQGLFLLLKAMRACVRHRVCLWVGEREEIEPRSGLEQWCRHEICHIGAREGTKAKS